MERECRTCKVVKPLDQFNKGNAKYGRKSECRECQGKRSKKYKQRPEVKEKSREWQKEKYHKLTQDERTKLYIRSKPYVKKWIENNPEKAMASRKVRSTRRQLRMKDAGPLDLSSVIALQDYNVNTYGNCRNPYTCEYCLQEIEGSYHLEHIVPISKGGKNVLENLAISCQTCNLKKLAKDLEDWDKAAFDRLTQRKL